MRVTIMKRVNDHSFIQVKCQKPGANRVVQTAGKGRAGTKDAIHQAISAAIGPEQPPLGP